MSIEEKIEELDRLITYIESVLKAKQDEIPKGAFYKGIDNLNKQIADTTKELKLKKKG